MMNDTETLCMEEDLLLNLANINKHLKKKDNVWVELTRQLASDEPPESWIERIGTVMEVPTMPGVKGKITKVMQTGVYQILCAFDVSCDDVINYYAERGFQPSVFIGTSQ